MLQVFSIYDKRAETFMPPFYQRNANSAIRVIADTIKADANTTIARYPEDFCLYSLAEFDEFSGAFLEISRLKIVELSGLVKDGEPLPQVGGDYIV